MWNRTVECVAWQESSLRWMAACIYYNVDVCATNRQDAVRRLEERLLFCSDCGLLFVRPLWGFFFYIHMLWREWDNQRLLYWIFPLDGHTSPDD